MQTLLDWLSKALAWVFTAVDWAIKEIIQLLLAGLAEVLNLIPVPGWMTNAPGVIGAMDPGVAYVAGLFMLPQGIAIIVGAYGIRFLIRRLPFIG